MQKALRIAFKNVLETVWTINNCEANCSCLGNHWLRGIEIFFLIQNFPNFAHRWAQEFSNLPKIQSEKPFGNKFRSWRGL